MRLNFKQILLSVIVATFIACGGGDTPKSVAEKFLKSLNKMDYETAKKYGSEDTGKLLDMMSGFANLMPDSAKQERSFEMKEEKINGDKATVTYAASGEEGEQSLNLIKIDGKWKVAMSKDSMNDTEGSSMDAGATSTDTSSANETVPADTSAR